MLRILEYGIGYFQTFDFVLPNYRQLCHTSEEHFRKDHIKVATTHWKRPILYHEQFGVTHALAQHSKS